MTLPDFKPITEEIEAPSEYRPQLRGPQVVWPAVQKLSDGSLAVDWWQGADGKIMIRKWNNADHPNMKALPVNAPRTVKQLYRREFQLRLLRAVGTAAQRDINRAETDWKSYASKPQRPAQQNL